MVSIVIPDEVTTQNSVSVQQVNTSSKTSSQVDSYKTKNTESDVENHALEALERSAKRKKTRVKNTRKETAPFPKSQEADISTLLSLVFAEMSHNLQEKAYGLYTKINEHAKTIENLNRHTEAILNHSNKNTDQTLNQNAEEMKPVIQALKEMNIEVPQKEVLNKIEKDTLLRSIEDRRSEIQTRMEILQREFSSCPQDKNILCELAKSVADQIRGLNKMICGGIKGA